MAWDLSSLTWSRTSQTKSQKKAEKAAPAPDPKPYVVPHPIGRVGPYVPANFDYADNPEYPNYDEATGGRKLWKNKKISQGGQTFVAPPGTYPPAGYDPDDWHGYRQSDWQQSELNEHLINGDEGRPPFGYHRYHQALNPYWYQIPDSRPVRTPHEYDFRRPFMGGLDGQPKMGKRNLTGDHYSAGNIGMTANPSESLKGMTAQRYRRTTHRVEPIEWGEDRVQSTSGVGPGTMYPNSAVFGNGYAL
jgi:hypothetical protein